MRLIRVIIARAALKRPKPEVLGKSISATIDNGKGLLDDAKMLFDLDRFSTGMALAVLAQEEFAKAFVLQLVADDALPWLPEVRMSIARHHCKHLLAIVMEWLPITDWGNYLRQRRRDSERHEAIMAWYRRAMDRYKQGILDDPEDPKPTDPQVGFPADVAHALNIYRHEEIERLTRSGYVPRDPEAKEKSRKIADGALDRKKQSGLYVAITPEGAVGVHPGLITREDAESEIKRAERLSEMPDILSDEYRELRKMLPLVFSDLLKRRQACDRLLRA
jgi:AbiV family abortive infection protein